MSNYNNFSPFYDLFTGNVNYKRRAAYLLKIFTAFDKKPQLLLDFACGTGNFSVEFAKCGIEVIGVDKSDGMLCEAQRKNLKLDNPVMYLCQSGEELDLFGTVDGAVSCLDSLNHITDIEALRQTFCNISMFLEPNRLFVFDMNTVYKHQNVLADSSYRMRKKGVDCFWSNKLRQDGVTVDISLEFVYKTGFLKREHISESFSERAYTKEELVDILKSSGFMLEAVYGENSFASPSEKSQRNVYVARKVK